MTAWALLRVLAGQVLRGRGGRAVYVVVGGIGGIGDDRRRLTERFEASDLTIARSPDGGWMTRPMVATCT